MDHIVPMIYAVDVRKAKSAPRVVGNTRGAALLSSKLFAGLETPMGVNTTNLDSADIANINSRDMVKMEGNWVRHTTLKAGKTWTVSSVVGLVAKGQQRRSFLAYSERERAAAWHPMTIYNSWYELNIDRNNAPGNRGIYDPNDKQTLTLNDFGVGTRQMVNKSMAKFFLAYQYITNQFGKDVGRGYTQDKPEITRGFLSTSFYNTLTADFFVAYRTWLRELSGNQRSFQHFNLLTSQLADAINGVALKKGFFTGEVNYKTLLSALNKWSQAAAKAGRFQMNETAFRFFSLLDEALDGLVEEKYNGLV